MDGLLTGTAGATISGAAISLNENSNFAVNIATGTSTGAVAIGGGSNTVSINSSDWKITAVGTMTGIGAITMDGLLTGTAGATISGAAISLNENSNFAVNIATGSSTGAISLGSGSNTVSINSNDWDISSDGTMTGIGALTMNGLLSASAGATISGAVIDLNAGSNYAVNIGTGASNGAVTIGGGSNTFALNSTALDISTAGVIFGATGITSS